MITDAIRRNALFKMFQCILRGIIGRIPVQTAAERECRLENKLDRKNGLFNNPLAERAITQFKHQKGSFNSFSLAESSVRCFVFNMLTQQRDEYAICEFGGGQSTIFWSILANHVKLSVTTYEHDPEWGGFLVNSIHAPSIRIHVCELMQICDDVRDKMFKSPRAAGNVWRESCTTVDPEQYKNPVLRNGFYNISSDVFPEKKITALVVDGPHGNGRSLCFPLFYDYIDDHAIVLIDDYHHYPFVDDLGMLFQYDIIMERRYVHSNKGWVVIQLKGRK